MKKEDTLLFEELLTLLLLHTYASSFTFLALHYTLPVCVNLFKIKNMTPIK